jgi:hypothetical protein
MKLHGYELSFADASRLLRGKRSRVEMNSFTFLSPTDNGGFRKREVDLYDEESMASTLCIESDGYYMTRTNGKRLRLISPNRRLVRGGSTQPFQVPSKTRVDLST